VVVAAVVKAVLSVTMVRATAAEEAAAVDAPVRSVKAAVPVELLSVCCW
jgi:hypothetical protein